MLTVGMATARAALGCVLGAALFLVVQGAGGTMIALAVVAAAVIGTVFAIYR
jgi:hypothetical protein